MKKIFTIIISLILTLSPFASVSAYDNSTAMVYLLSHSSNPWSTMALAALGTTTIPDNYLKNINGTEAVDYEAPILAITALNQDPRTFGFADYVGKLKSFYANGQIGDVSLLNDDIFGILALVSSGISSGDVIVENSKNYILSHQNSDGGWSYSTTGSSDSSMTSAAIVALAATGVSSPDPQIQNALQYLKTVQNSDGGIAPAKGSPSDSPSTAWVVWALNALNIDPTSWDQQDSDLTSYLNSMQTPDGYFKYQTGSSEDGFSAIATAYAVIALSGKALPINIVSGQDASAVYPFRIEGFDQAVCEGETNGPTALDIVKNASAQCGFAYSIKSSGFGDYLNKINDDAASGMTGWMYFVNNSSPEVGAADYVLKPDDSVLWYFGDWGWQPSRLSLSSAEIASGRDVTALVESFDGSSWAPVSDADVYLGATSLKTSSDGRVLLQPRDGYYKVHAQKAGMVRTNSVLLKAGEPGSESVLLSANVTGEVKGITTPDVISFTVTPASLDFGDVAVGSVSTKTLSISNTSNIGIDLAANVSGDDIFTDYLSLNNAFWRNFQANLQPGSQQDISAKLTLPERSFTAGQRTGTIVFWARGN